jgi:hypothetical protein
MLPIAKFIEPNWAKLIPFITVMILFYFLLFPTFSKNCYYGEDCKMRDVACVASAYDSLTTCERTKTLYAMGLTILAYLIGCLFFLGYKLLSGDAYSYYYEQS